MNIKTESIIDLVEINLNKKIDDVSIEELDKITYLRICRMKHNEFLTVNFDDLKYFKNLREISIEGCTIDDTVLEEIKKLKFITIISFIKCDFVENSRDFFESISLEQLVLNNISGLDNVNFNNVNNIIIVNCSMNCACNNVNVLDISRALNIKIDIDGSYINEIIINEKQLTDELLKLGCIIKIKNNYDEIVKVIEND